MLTYYSFSALLNAATSFFVGLFVLFTKGHNRLARYFVFFCFSVTLWATPYFFWQISETATDALLWGRILMVGAILVPVSFLHLSMVLTREDRRKKNKHILIASYLLAIVWLIFDATPLFMEEIKPAGPFEFFFDIGPAYHFFLASFLIEVGIAFHILIRAYRQYYGVVQKQIGLFLIGTSLALIAGSTNYFLLYDIPISPIGNAFAGIYILFTLYAIMRYQFLDLRIIWAEIFTFILIILMLIKTVFFSGPNSNMLFEYGAFFLTLLLSSLLLYSLRASIQWQETHDTLKKLEGVKSSFIRLAAHQLRTPLSVIRGYTELLRDGTFGSLPVGMSMPFKAIADSTGRMVRLVDEFLIINDIEQDKKTTLLDHHDMRSVINSAIKDIQARAMKAEVLIHWKKPEKQYHITLDKRQIDQVIYSFIENSICYAKRGDIYITLQEEKQHGQRGLSVRVKDNGIGFDASDKKRFFKKFSRGRNVSDTDMNFGAGISMYISRRFIEQHNGTIWAKSDGLHQGAEFGFWIPYNLREH